MRRSVLAMALMTTSTASAAGYRLDPAKSLFVVKTQKDGMAGRLAHNHVVAARDPAGTIAHDADRPGASSISVEVQVSKLVLDDPALRRRFGETSVPSKSDHADTYRNMMGADQLDAARFPKMSFVSTEITRQADGKFLVKGDLTMHGVTRAVSFPATVDTAGGAFAARGEFTVKQSQFGISPYSAMLGTIRVKDEVTFVLDVVGIPLAAAPASGAK